ncbi:MAG: outer membrane beta-barrel protein [Eudoraea sp.]|nr:outer membrane beta-barrel protein [Eudoraea sp.]
MKKNNIDHVFKDRLKDYQETPEEGVWESISASLDQKKSKRRVLPLWWKLGGIAAALALLLYLFLPTGIDVTPAEVTDTEKPEVIEKTTVPGDRQAGERLLEADAVVEQAETQSGEQMNSLEQPISKTAVTSRETGSNKADMNNNTKTVLGGQGEAGTKGNNALAERDQGDGNAPISETGNKAQEDTRVARNEVLPNTGKQTQQDPNKLQEGVALAEVAEEHEEGAVADETKKKSIFEVLEEQEEEAVAETTSDRWSVGPMVAPVYFNTLAEGSPVHSNFVANTKSGNINLSYGVAVSYQITDKLSVRSGLHRVDYGYDTDDIRFSSSLTASTSTLIENIDYDSNSRTLVVESRASRGAQESAALDASEVNAPSPAREGRMVQDFGYLEVPMELQYNLVDNKLGVNLIGGLSSLFLMENTVTLVADNAATSMGEANNINEVNFSTNFGLGLYYRFTPKMQLNLEPMFKYQLNTFSDAAGNFQPFSLGVYSGLSFKF